MFDADGAVVQYTRYEPYGGLREDATFDPDPADGVTPLQTDFLYNGKEQDATFGPEADIYDFGPRMYFADVGTWLSPDPTFSDGPNRYGFGKADPINHADPTGRAAPLIAGVSIYVIGNTLWDLGSVGLDVYDIYENGLGYLNGASLAFDVYSVVNPALPGGVGYVRKAWNWGGALVNNAPQLIQLARKHGGWVLVSSQATWDSLRHSDRGVVI